LAFNGVEIRLAESDAVAVVADQRQPTYALMTDRLLVVHSPQRGPCDPSGGRSDDNRVVVKLESPTAVVFTEELHEERGEIVFRLRLPSP